MRVLVTGHDGYIGSVLVPLARAAGHEVIGLDSGLFDACLLGEPAPGPDRELRKDLRDLRPADLEGIEGVVHLAALSNDPLGDLDPALTFAINLDASRHLAELARSAGVRRFVFSSSCSNYGRSGEEELGEDAELRPLTPYAVSKVRFEEALRELADETFSPVLLRNATVYGVSPRPRLDLVVNNLVASGLGRGRIVLLSDGSPWRPLVHVEDVARVALAALEAPREAVHARALNVVPPGENYRVREVAEIVSRALGGCPTSFAEGAAADARDYRVSGVRLAEALPGTELRWTVERGVDELVDTFRRHGLGIEALEGPRFRRLAWIQHLVDTGRIGRDLRWTGAAPVGEARPE